MAGRRKEASRRGRAKAGRARRGYGGYFAVLLCLAAASYVLWTDHVVQKRFEGRRWSLPARAYARPLEIFPGSRIDRDRVLAELALLGYRKVDKVTGTGQYSLASGSITLHTRGFRFLDGIEKPARVQIRFGADTVRAIETVKGTELPVLRIEPYELARIYPEDREDRILVRLDEVPRTLIDAVLAIEDRNFYHHPGIDFRAIARALWANIKAGEIRQGGSTITQQLVKNFYLSHERSLARKINEALMALILEYRYSKNEILEAYMNEIFLGQDGPRAIHGFGLASEFYFGQPLNELAPHQLALLAGLARGASYYDPRRHPERAKARRNHVLSVMADVGAMQPDQARAQSRNALDVTPKPLATGSRFPAFMQLVRRQLAADYRDEDLRTEGLQIFTTLDPYVQERAERAVARVLPKLEQQKKMTRGSLETAVVVAEPATGEVLALVGGRDPAYTAFNRAIDARRPIGSLVKPAVFLAALALPERYHVSTRISDAQLSLRGKDGKSWTPRNYDGKSHGMVPLHEALAQSYNLATIRLGLDVGMDRVQQSLRNLGVTVPIPDYPSIMLGSIELSPLEASQIYLTIAADGFRVPPRAIREVLTREGRPLTRYGIDVRASIDRRLAYLLRYLLTRTVAEGTAREAASALRSSLPLAGKTGTTNDLRDSWFAGFGSDVLALVWIGRDDNAPAGYTGSSGALRVWTELMRDLEPAPISLHAPEGVEWHWYDVRSAQRTDPECVGARSYPFLAGALPGDYVPCAELRSLPADSFVGAAP